MGGKGRRIPLLLVTIAACLAAPASAVAADTYVDQASGSDANDCLQPADGAPGEGPCETIAAAIAKAQSGDAIHVADSDPDLPTTYAETLVLDDDKRLLASSSDPAETIIDNGSAAAPAITVDPGPDGTGGIFGFTIRSDTRPIELDGTARVEGNVFDQPAPPSDPRGAAIEVAAAAGSPQIVGNQFTDPDPTDAQAGVYTHSTESAEIAGNSFEGLSQAVVAIGDGGTPLIGGNQIAGTHSIGGSGEGVLVRDQTASVIGNRIAEPDPAAAGEAGIRVDEGAAADPTGAALERNSVLGLDFGVDVKDTEAPVSLYSDLLAKNGVGLRAENTTSGPGPADLTATNLTAFGSTGPGPAPRDIRSIDNQLTLDSSIVGDGIGSSNDTVCEISFSRGPTTSGGECASFQTTVGPGFVNPASGNYHLARHSPMIDAGDPDGPPPDALDLDGGPRGVDGADPCGARRDIGADEFAVVLDCDPPETFLSRHPRRRTRDRTPSFGLRSDEPGAGFECKLDRHPFRPCPATVTFGRQRHGRHRLVARATDRRGNVDPTPVRFGFRIRR